MPASSRSNSSGRGVPISMLISVAVEPIISGTSAETSGADGQLGPAGRFLPSATGRHTARSFACEAFTVAAISVSIGSSSSLRASVGCRSSAASSVCACLVAASARHRLQMRVAGVGAALDDRAMEQAFACRHRHHGRDLAAAAGLAEDRHVGRIAAEFGDVVAHPFERRDQIEHAGIGAVGELRQQLPEIEKAERVQPVVDRDQHHVAAAAPAACRRTRCASRRARRSRRRGTRPSPAACRRRASRASRRSGRGSPPPSVVGSVHDANRPRIGAGGCGAMLG